MSEGKRFVLGAGVVVAVIIIAFSVWGYSRSYARSIVSPRTFVVTGEGKIAAIPDIATISFGVRTEGGKDLQKLQTDNTDRANRAIEFIKSKGVAATDIKTDLYQISPRYNYNPCPQVGSVCPPQEIIGYTVYQSVSVKVRALATVGDLYGGVISAGANEATPPLFDIDNKDALEASARALAIAQARDKAAAMARAGNFSLGRLVSITEGYPPFPTDSRPVGAESLAPATPQIMSGSQNIQSTVSLTYEIE